MDSVKLKKITTKVLVTIYLQLLFIFALRSVIVNLSNVRASYYSEFASRKRAVTLYNRSLLLDKKNIYALIWCGYVYEDQDNNDKAQKYYEQAIKYNPDIDEGYYFMGVLHSRKRQYQRAKQYFEKACELNGARYQESKKFLENLNKNI
ncbi:MAG: tetratricopeptide repeat protein [bacterium]|nr:tetratricopeptide repeat protein [bacterium]